MIFKNAFNFIDCADGLLVTDFNVVVIAIAHVDHHAGNVEKTAYLVLRVSVREARVQRDGLLIFLAGDSVEACVDVVLYGPIAFSSVARHHQFGHDADICVPFIVMPTASGRPLPHLFGNERPVAVGVEGKKVALHAHEDVAHTSGHRDVFKTAVHIAFCISPYS